jgi:hypothetical protein
MHTRILEMKIRYYMILFSLVLRFILPVQSLHKRMQQQQEVPSMVELPSSAKLIQDPPDPTTATMSLPNPPVDDKIKAPSQTDRNSARKTDLKSADDVDDSYKPNGGEHDAAVAPPDPAALMPSSHSGPVFAKVKDPATESPIDPAKHPRDASNARSTTVRDDLVPNPADRKSPSISSNKGSQVLEVSYASVDSNSPTAT